MRIQNKCTLFLICKKNEANPPPPHRMTGKSHYKSTKTRTHSVHYILQVAGIAY